MEKPLFFNDRSGKKLFGFLFVPDQITRKQGIIICQPFAEEKNRVKRVLVNYARFLSRKGFAVFMFDYYGEGDSEGLFESATIASRIDNALDAVNYLKNVTGVTSFGFVGIRLGGTVAFLAADQLRENSFIILCQPIINCSNFFREWLMVNLAAQLVIHKEIKLNRDQLEEKINDGDLVEIEGFIVGKTFYSELIKLSLHTHNINFIKNILLIEFSDNITRNSSFKNFMIACQKHSVNIEYFVIKKEFDWINMKIYNPYPEKFFNSSFEWIERNQ